MADEVTPVRMLMRYWSLKVPTVDGVASVAVNSYKCSTPAYGGTVNEEKIKDAFIGVSKHKIIGEAGGAVPYVNAFVGKASPEGEGNWAKSTFNDLVQYNDGFRTNLIGTPEQIAERIVALKQVGVNLVLLGFLHYLEEVEFFGKRVLPLVRQLEQAQTKAA